jgi:diguanylate cyclase (GGDEF)-like protein/PAS domain S-box-containing protein
MQTLLARIPHPHQPLWLLPALLLLAAGCAYSHWLLRRAAQSTPVERRTWRWAALLLLAATLACAGLIALLAFESVSPAIRPARQMLPIALSLLLGLAGSVALFLHHHINIQPIRELERMRQLADGTFEGIVLCRETQILDVNLPFCVLLGLSAQALRECTLTQLAAPGSKDALEALLRSAPLGPVEIELRNGNGGFCPVEMHSRPIEYAGRPATVLAVRDLSERKQAQHRIDHLIHHDALTNLANRLLFHDRLQRAMAETDRTGQSMALLYIDLDRFKSVNDMLGHANGDDVLVQIASRMQEATRRIDTVARLGGDEFAVVQPRCLSPQGAATLSSRLLRLIQQPILIGAHPVSVCASIGIALYPQDGATVEELLQNADLALYRAKQSRGSSFCFFEPEMDRRLQERRALEIDLQKTLQNNQLYLHYQPQFSTSTLELEGFEALVRWHHPQQGNIPPSDFIPLAEETGLILSIGRWVMMAACLEAASWPRPYRVAVNVSAVQVQHGTLAETVVEVLRATGLPPEQLELEVTESLFLGNLEAIAATLHDLKRLGVHITLDDFGTGYSSLGYLRRFPFDTIKIDRSFITPLGQDPQADSIVQSIVALSHSLKMNVIAEGIETETQLSALQSTGCDQVQGYLLGRPVLADSLASLREAGVFAPQPAPSSPNIAAAKPPSSARPVLVRSVLSAD